MERFSSLQANYQSESRELVSMIREQLKVRMPQIYLPIFLGQVAGRALELTFQAHWTATTFSSRSMDFS